MDEDQQPRNGSLLDDDVASVETPARMTSADDADLPLLDESTEGARFVAEVVETPSDIEPDVVVVDAEVVEDTEPDDEVEFVDEITVEPEEDVETREVVVFDDLAEEEVAPEPEPPATAVNPDAEIDAYSPFRTPPEPVVTPEEPADATTEMTQADLLAAERAERKAARDKALGTVERTPEPEPAPPVKVQSNDKFFPSLGLFLLRMAITVVFGVRAVQHFTNLQDTSDLIGTTWIPQPGIMALVLCVGEILIAVGMLFGILTRIAGLGVTIVATSALVFVWWGASNPFVADRFGFVGEYELVLAAVGLLYLLVGAGAWSVDGSVRRARRRRKETGD